MLQIKLKNLYFVKIDFKFRKEWLKHDWVGKVSIVILPVRGLAIILGNHKVQCPPVSWICLAMGTKYVHDPWEKVGKSI